MGSNLRWQRAGPLSPGGSSQGLCPPSLSFMNHPSLLHDGMPECPSLGCLLAPWLTTCFPFPENRQKEQLSTKGRPFRGMSEEEVFTEVANLFRGQEDLLSEFGQFLPEAKRSLVSTEHPPPSGATFPARTPHLSAAFRPGRVYPLPRDTSFPPKPHPVQPPMGPECRLHALIDREQVLRRASLDREQRVGGTVSSNGDLPVTGPCGAGGVRLTACLCGGTGWTWAEAQQCLGGGIDLGAEEGPGMGSSGAQTAPSAFPSLLRPKACQAAFSISFSSFSFLANLTGFRKKLKESSRNTTFTVLKCTVQ